jgi:hypothetical protein
MWLSLQLSGSMLTAWWLGRSLLIGSRPSLTLLASGWHLTRARGVLLMGAWWSH